MRRGRHRLITVLAGAAVAVSALAIQAGTGRAGVPVVPVYDGNSGFMRTCIFAPQGRVRDCYIRRLLTLIEKTQDPANELPRIDRRVRQAGGYVQSNCHMMMHVVGRMYARRHHVTLANLQRNLPRSNDPGCSAGFGMGLVMALGDEIGRLGTGRRAEDLRACADALPFVHLHPFPGSCVHAPLPQPTGLRSQGLPDTARELRRRTVRRVRTTTTGSQPSAETGRNGSGAALQSARSLCGRQIHDFVRPCWFRYFLETAAEASAHERSRRARAVPRACRHSARRLHLGGVTDHIRRPVQADEASARGCEVPTPSAACMD